MLVGQHTHTGLRGRAVRVEVVPNGSLVHFPQPAPHLGETRTCAIPIGALARFGRLHLAACLEACAPVCSQTFILAFLDR